MKLFDFADQINHVSKIIREFLQFIGGSDKLFDLSNEINRGHFEINRPSFEIIQKETKSRSTNRSGKQQVGLKHPWGEPDELKGDEKDKWI